MLHLYTVVGEMRVGVVEVGEGEGDRGRATHTIAVEIDAEGGGEEDPTAERNMNAWTHADPNMGVMCSTNCNATTDEASHMHMMIRTECQISFHL